MCSEEPFGSTGLSSTRDLDASGWRKPPISSLDYDKWVTDESIMSVPGKDGVAARVVAIVLHDSTKKESAESRLLV
jgi:hypothetical protein